MEDLRDAEKTVSEFARLIDNLRASCSASHTEVERPGLPHNQSYESHRSNKSSISLSSRWRSKNLKKDWDETIEGILWNELEQAQNKVAHKFRVDQTALKEYISSPEMMDLGCEFARHYNRHLYSHHPQHQQRQHQQAMSEQGYWVAEDLFFDLQAVKQGDADAGRWAEAKVYKKDWDLADHLMRFVLLAEQCRLCSGQEKWVAWQWSFANNVSFYLSVLRCYTVRDAKQRQLAAASGAGGSGGSSGGGSPPSSRGSKESSRRDRTSPPTRNGKRD